MEAIVRIYTLVRTVITVLTSAFLSLAREKAEAKSCVGVSHRVLQSFNNKSVYNRVLVT